MRQTRIKVGEGILPRRARSGGKLGDDRGREFWRVARDEHGHIQWNSGDADELECDQHYCGSAERSGDWKCCGDSRWSGEQRDELHGDASGFSAEYYEPESGDGSRGDFGDYRGNKFWSDAGNEHGHIQWNSGDAD